MYRAKEPYPKARSGLFCVAGFKGRNQKMCNRNLAVELLRASRRAKHLCSVSLGNHMEALPKGTCQGNSGGGKRTAPSDQVRMHMALVKGTTSKNHVTLGLRVSVGLPRAALDSG